MQHVRLLVNYRHNEYDPFRNSESHLLSQRNNHSTVERTETRSSTALNAPQTLGTTIIGIVTFERRDNQRIGIQVSTTKFEFLLREKKQVSSLLSMDRSFIDALILCWMIHQRLESHSIAWCRLVISGMLFPDVFGPTW